MAVETLNQEAVQQWAQAETPPLIHSFNNNGFGLSPSFAKVSNIWHNIEDKSNNPLSPSNKLGNYPPQETKQPIPPMESNMNTDAGCRPPSPAGSHSENDGTTPPVMQEGAFIIEVADVQSWYVQVQERVVIGLCHGIRPPTKTLKQWIIHWKGQWFIRNTSLSVFKWYEGFNPRGDKPTRVPVWVDFPDLPVDFYPWLKQMGGQLGKVLGQKAKGGINPKWDPQILIEIDLKQEGHLIRNCPDLLPKEPEKDKLNEDANSFQQVQRKNAYRPPKRPINLSQKVPTQQTKLEKAFDPFLYDQFRLLVSSVTGLLLVLVSGLLLSSLWLLVSSVTGLVSAGSGLWSDMDTSIVSSSISIEERYPFSLSQLCRLCYPVISLEWDHIEQLAREKNLDELEWLIRLLTTSDPYPVEDMHPIAQIYPLAQVDYTRLVRFLVLLYEEDDEDIEDDWTDMSHGMTDNDFIYLDDEDKGLALGLPPNLYNILFP
ncbi:hypothetical protein L7F22_047044 [Adiantum nelumboides]|nr:hypothetical protein [Adiantum nelumboides]